MITEGILNVLSTIIRGLLGLLPDLPSLDSSVIDAANTFVNIVYSVVGFIAYLYTPTIFLLVFGILIAVINFDAIYKLVTWIYHKVRG